MKRTISLLLAAALGLGLLSGCAQASAAKELTAEPIKLTDADMMAHALEVQTVHAALTDFGLDLLQKSRDKEKKATLVSPLSVALALSMTANGAEGDTLAQFQEVLGDGASIEAINVACRALTVVYRNLGGSTQCSIANSLWVDPDGQIKDDFIGTCRGVFDAQVFQGELSAPGIVGDLNGWVSEHTSKMIPKIIDQPFPEETACLLVNALYLKNSWLSEFSPNATHERAFHHEGGSDSRMDFLSKHDATLSYLQGKGAQGVVLPYDDGRLAFVAILPDLYPDSPDLGQWLNNLEGNSLSQLIINREDALFLSFAMPKFSAEWKGNLEDILPLLGLEDAFVNGTADFSNLGDNPEGYFINQVIHATKIEVNEKGTEAAAATVVDAPAGSAPPQEGITLILDRPFLYGIVDLYTGVPLFLGTYE
ncbi:MAG: serine protease [Lawsonibacter sp.]|jgi:serine protease inhibitor|nr:serine protease [Lawsonibacter sp.]